MATANLNAEAPMHDHPLAGHGGPIFTTACGLAALASRAAESATTFAAGTGLEEAARLLQAVVTPLLVFCTLAGFAYSTINFLANWPETRAKFRRNRELKATRRRARIIGRYPEELEPRS